MNRRSFFASIIGATLAAKLLPLKPAIQECKFWSLDERIVTLSTPRNADWAKRYYTITGTEMFGNLVTEKIEIGTPIINAASVEWREWPGERESV